MLVKTLFENRFDAFVGDGFDHQSLSTGGFEAFRGVSFYEPHDIQAGTEALLRMWSALHDLGDKPLGLAAKFPGSLDGS